MRAKFLQPLALPAFLGILGVAPNCATGVQPSTYARPALEIDLGGPQAIVPVDVSGGHIAVEVYLGERGPYRFHIDTYASVDACIDDDLARELGLPVVSQGLNSDGRTTRSVDFVNLDEVRLGPATFRGLTCLVDDYDFVPTTGGGSLQGLLGYTLFQDLLFSVDYPASRVILQRGQLEPGAPGTAPLLASSGVPDVHVRVGGHELRFGIDTGMDGTIRLFESDLENLSVHGDAPVIGMAQTVYSKYSIRGAFLAEPIGFAGGSFDAAYAHIMPDDQSSLRLLGFGFFRDGVLTFDQARQLVHFRRPDRPAVEDALDSAWPGTYAAGSRSIVVERDDKGLVVTFRGGPRLRATAVSPTELAFEANAMRLHLRGEPESSAGLYVANSADLSDDWFAPRAE